MEYDKYVKVTYESDPIGPEKIILRLTTFDIEAYERDEKLSQIPKKEEGYVQLVSRSELNEPYSMHLLEQQLETYIDFKYKREIESMKTYIEYLRNKKDLDCNIPDSATMFNIRDITDGRFYG